MKFSSISLLFPALFSLLALTGCAQNPVSGRQEFVAMSESDEVRMGRQSDTEVKQEYGTYDLPALQQYVNQVGQRLAAKSHRSRLEFHFTVVDSPDINAFALPGGYIYITRGIMAYLNSEAELAAVLGHEIGHVTARHSVQQYTATTATSIGIALGSLFVPELGRQAAQGVANLLGNALLSGYGRDHELEADRLGAEYLARAGYDPQAMVRVIGILKNQELFDADIAKQEGREPRRYHGVFASHPENDERLQQLVGEANQFTLRNAAAEEGQAIYLANMNKVIFGDSPEQGIVRDNMFLHEGLGIALTFPRDWKIQNRPDKLLALNPSNETALEMKLAAQPDIPPAEFLHQALKMDAGSSVDAARINGLPAAIATGIQSGKPIKIGAIYLQKRVFFLIGNAKSPEAFSRFQNDMNATIRSFHTMSTSDRKLAKPYVIQTTIARKGVTFDELARKSPLGKNAEGYLRLMNNAYPQGEPLAGQTLKIVQ